MNTLQARDLKTKKLIGLAHYFPIPNLRRGDYICYLDVLVVDPAWRRRGVASEILEELRRVANKKGWKGVRWVTDRVNNEGPKKLYQQFGESDLDMFHMKV